jgi:acylphosphatase
VKAIAQRLLIRGRVQGVGYRDAAVQAACALGVCGWVRNRRDGSVEAVAQGAPDAVERFAAWCRRGPPLARVEDIGTIDADVDAELGAFEMRATV